MAWLNNTLGNSDILFKASHDNGTSFGPVINLSSNPAGDSIDPRITAAGSYVYVVWQENNSTVTNNEVYFRASPNNGTSFNSIVDVSRDSADSTVPQIAAVSNNVTIVWQTSSTTHNDPFDIDYKISTQHGTDLGSVAVKNLSNNAGSSLSPQIAISGHNVYVTWEDNFPGNYRTFFCHSSNSGTSFSSPVDLSRGSVTGETDLYQQITAAGSNVYVAWTNDTTILTPTVITNDTTVITASTTSGSVFNAPIRLSNLPDTSLNPYMAASGGNVYVVWTDSPPGQNSEIFYKRSINNGANFDPTINLSSDSGTSTKPSIAGTGSNVYVAWDDVTPGNDEIFFVSSGDNGGSFGATLPLSSTTGSSTLPVVAGVGSNAYVAWEDDAVGNGDIFFRGTGAPPVVPDATVSLIVLSRSFAYSGVLANPIVVNVTASNPGSVSETFFVTLKANGTLLGNQTVTNLAPKTGKIVTFSWNNTASLTRGNYILTAHASQVPGETNLSNNDLTWGGTFTAKFKGDVNGDCKVDIVDLATVGATFGKTPGTAGFNSAADLNNDGAINIVDLVLVAGSFGQTC